MRRTLEALVVVAVVAGCTPPAPVDDADPQGTLTTAIDQEPVLDPQLVGSARDVASVNMVFEPLLRFDPKTLRLMPAAAKALPEISADGLTYRIQVSADSKYSDGTPVRARDFVYTLVRYCDPAIAGDASFLYAVVGCEEWNRSDPKKDPPEKVRDARAKLTGTGIRATGENELTIQLVYPAAYFASILALPMSAPVRESDVLHGGEAWTEPETYVGNGPFVLSAWKHRERLVFTPNRYYRTPSKVRQWTKLIIIEPRVALEAYRHDEVDALAFGSNGTSLFEEVQADPLLKQGLALVETGCTAHLNFNVRRPPFDDPFVRLAFAKAIDRDAFIRDVVKLGRPATSFIAPGLPGFDPADTVQRSDPTEARRLLASSRYAGGSTFPAIVLQRDLQPNSRIRDEWLQAQWRTNLGVDVQLEAMAGPQLSQLFRKPETVPQIWFDGWCGDYPDQHVWLTVAFRSQIGLAHLFGFSDPDFDRLVDQADRERDQQRRDDLYRQASRLLSERAPSAFVYYGVSLSLSKPWVKGIMTIAMGGGSYPGSVEAERVFVTKKGRSP